MKVHNWTAFKAALLKRYGITGHEMVFERLAAVRQQGSVAEFVQEFELLVAQMSSASEEQLMEYFFTGLQPDVRCSIRPHKPKDLSMAMELAGDFEEIEKEELKLGEVCNRGPRFMTKSSPFTQSFLGSHPNPSTSIISQVRSNFVSSLESKVGEGIAA